MAVMHRFGVPAAEVGRDVLVELPALLVLRRVGLVEVRPVARSAGEADLECAGLTGAASSVEPAAPVRLGRQTAATVQFCLGERQAAVRVGQQVGEALVVAGSVREGLVDVLDDPFRAAVFGEVGPRRRA
jgi:hypothetical protein